MILPRALFLISRLSVPPHLPPQRGSLYQPTELRLLAECNVNIKVRKIIIILLLLLGSRCRYQVLISTLNGILIENIYILVPPHTATFIVVVIINTLSFLLWFLLHLYPLLHIRHVLKLRASGELTQGGLNISTYAVQ